MIIGGVLGIILGIIAVIGAGIIVAASGDTSSLGLLLSASLLVLVSMVASLVAGILGVVNAAKPEKANVCIVFGFIIVAFTILGNILNVIGGKGFSFMGLLIGLILPALYILGAFQNKKLLTDNPAIIEN